MQARALVGLLILAAAAVGPSVGHADPGGLAQGRRLATRGPTPAEVAVLTAALQYLRRDLPPGPVVLSTEGSDVPGAAVAAVARAAGVATGTLPKHSVCLRVRAGDPHRGLPPLDRCRLTDAAAVVAPDRLRIRGDSAVVHLRYWQQEAGAAQRSGRSITLLLRRDAGGRWAVGRVLERIYTMAPRALASDGSGSSRSG